MRSCCNSTEQNRSPATFKTTKYIQKDKVKHREVGQYFTPSFLADRTLFTDFHAQKAKTSTNKIRSKHHQHMRECFRPSLFVAYALLLQVSKHFSKQTRRLFFFFLARLPCRKIKQNRGTLQKKKKKLPCKNKNYVKKIMATKDDRSSALHPLFLSHITLFTGYGTKIPKRRLTYTWTT